MAGKIEWSGTLDICDPEIEGSTDWPARVERDEDGRMRLRIAGEANGSGEWTAPSRCRDADPEIAEALAAELRACRELD